ncbi:MAG: hypothetical protein ACYCT2_03180 [Thermoplasmataceae archaeon]
MLKITLDNAPLASAEDVVGELLKLVDEGEISEIDVKYIRKSSHSIALLFYIVFTLSTVKDLFKIFDEFKTLKLKGSDDRSVIAAPLESTLSVVGPAPRELFKSFIKALKHGDGKNISIHMENSEGLHIHLDSRDAERAKNLSMKEVYEDRISGGQLSYLERVMKNDSARPIITQYLEKNRVDVIQYLTRQQASGLVRILKNMENSGTLIREISSNQINYINRLARNPANLHLVNEYLKEVEKGNIEELTLSEADALINKLNPNP